MSTTLPRPEPIKRLAASVPEPPDERPGAKGAIIYSGRYGSTAQYSRWISEATGLPVFHIDDANADPSRYGFLVLGSSVVFYRATIRSWVKANWRDLRDRTLILFTVSGAAPGPKVDAWVAKSFPEEVLARMRHTALRGRLDHADVSWWLRILLKIGGMMNRDPEARKDEMHGFDYMDRSSIEPIVALIRECESSDELAAPARGTPTDATKA